MEYKYDVALSFAGEDREYVDKVAKLLKEKNVKVFYDKFEEAELWGKDLVTSFDTIYRKSARFCVPFISEHYKEKIWTRHEIRTSFARAIQSDEEYILPARFDDTEIEGMRPTIGFIDLRRCTLEEFVNVILKKLGNPNTIPITEITKRDISENEVIIVKENLENAKRKIEFASVTIDPQSSWEQKINNRYAFYFSYKENFSPLLVLSWSFINHLPKTLILTAITYDAVKFPVVGISGPPLPSILKSTVKYSIQIEWNLGVKQIILNDQIEIRENQAFRFETELFHYKIEDQKCFIEGKRGFIDFTFEFSGGQVIKVPRVFLNCISEDVETVIQAG